MSLVAEPYIGHAAAIAGALFWTATSLLFTAAGRRIGSLAVNTIRLPIAVVLLGLTYRTLSGQWIPDVPTEQVLLLALSGVVGLAIGDQCFFTAFVDIGPRLTTLLMTTSPLFAALFGYLALGETLETPAWLGMLLTITGVAWVLLEKPRQHPDDPAGGERVAPAAFISRGHPHFYRGVILAVTGAACQAGGLMLSKKGMGHGLAEGVAISPEAATLVRLVFATAIAIPVFLLFQGRLTKRNAGKRIGTRRAGYIFTSLGAIVGPYLGVWMSLIACDRAPLGIAQTLLSLTPIFVLPFAKILHHERIGLRAVAGTMLAVVGCALLFQQTS
jgi:drug/metabolite transporter (DMT)-like permease